jgi:DNA adenine methylase
MSDNVRFCDWIENVKVNVDAWHYYKNIQKEINNYSDLEIAKSTFFLNRTNISGVIKGGIIGGALQKGKYKIDVRFNKNDLLKRIARVNLFRDRIKVSNLDGVNFINNIVKRKADFFIYLDPPYVQKGADLYMNYYAKEDHKKLAKFVSKIPNRWLVSYDNNEFIVQLYERYRKINYQLSQAASNRIGDEILVFSDQLNFTESIKNLKAPVEM